jgi:integrase
MLTHGFRKLFKKRCRQAKVDAITLERFMGHKSGNSRDGITKLMMTYDPKTGWKCNRSLRRPFLA